jgi:hypothetical protein
VGVRRLNCLGRSTTAAAGFARQTSYFSCFARRSNQEKATRVRRLSGDEPAGQIPCAAHVGGRASQTRCARTAKPDCPRRRCAARRLSRDWWSATACGRMRCHLRPSNPSSREGSNTRSALHRQFALGAISIAPEFCSTCRAAAQLGCCAASDSARRLPPTDLRCSAANTGLGSDQNPCLKVRNRAIVERHPDFQASSTSCHSW